jgi:hypothetical protein
MSALMWRRLAVPGLLLALHGLAHAGDEAASAHAANHGQGRDPMQAPSVPTVGRSDTNTLTHANTNTNTHIAESAVRHLMVINGRRYIIEGGQRLGVGDRLGEARIERIDDGVVWLRDARGLRQVSLFGGIVKRPASETEATTAPRNTARSQRRAPAPRATQLASVPAPATKPQNPDPGTPSPR